MFRHARFSALILAGFATTGLTSLAQNPVPVQGQPPAQQGQRTQPQAAAKPSRMVRRSIVHHYPYPYPEMYHGDQSAGFRNPGGTGRFLEYYPPGNQFNANAERGEDPVRVAQFGGGGIPDRNEQLAAQSLGVAKYNAIQNHIDNMARPAFGFGFFGGAY